MNNFDSQPVSITLSPVSNSGIEHSRRLIVLIPYFEADFTAVTQRIWELANTMSAHVKFLGLYNETEQELSLRRQLATMSAMIRDGGVPTETEVIFGKDWVAVLRQRLQIGDTVVCFAKQRFGPLSHILQSDLPVPVYFLSGPETQNHPRLQWLRQVAAWTGSIAIILGFFAFQVKMDHLVKDWAHSTWLLLSIPIEIWMVWIWNNLFE